jgi:hypothetical protein
LCSPAFLFDVVLRNSPLLEADDPIIFSRTALTCQPRFETMDARYFRYNDYRDVSVIAMTHMARCSAPEIKIGAVMNWKEFQETVPEIMNAGSMLAS